MNTQDIEIKHAEIFDDLRDQITRLDDALTRHVFMSGNNQHVVVYALALRLIEFSKACHLLSVSGLAAVNGAVGRNCLEVWFQLKAVIKDGEKSKEYLCQELLGERRSLRRVLKCHGWEGLFSEVDINIFKNQLQELEVEIKNRDCREIKISEWAEFAGESEVYLTSYAVLSEFTHSGAGSLGHILKKENTGQIFMHAGSSDFWVNEVIQIVCSLLASSVTEIDGMFGVSVNEK